MAFPSTDSGQVLVIEDASLEIVPKELRSEKQVIEVARRFGVKPSSQILDRNFHSQAMKSLRRPSEKTGRPDVVHFALLDVTSTPLFRQNKIRIFIHTLRDDTIEVKSGTRPPRTLQRFCGVMSKLLSGYSGSEESKLFGSKPNQSFRDLIESLRVDTAVALTRQGRLMDLQQTVTRELSLSKKIAWIVGGFAHGSFDSEVQRTCDEMVAISDMSLPAHVVTARLCYELEKAGL
jgi:rRNA small subunit pseudouridine methyltransferase Nep1